MAVLLQGKTPQF